MIKVILFYADMGYRVSINKFKGSYNQYEVSLTDTESGIRKSQVVPLDHISEPYLTDILAHINTMFVNG